MHDSAEGGCIQTISIRATLHPVFSVSSPNIYLKKYFIDYEELIITELDQQVANYSS
jgi:hypothetical protein